MNIPTKYVQPATGVSGIWQRAQTVVVDNSLGAIPTITFNEEKIVQVSGEIIPGPAVTDTRITASLANPATTFQATDGTTYTYQQLADILTGLYFTLAAVRDQGV